MQVEHSILSLFIFSIAYIFADLDPNFSVLLDGTAGSSTTTCDHKLDENSDKRKPYYLIVVGIVVDFFVVLAVVLIFIRHR
jgi:hypothetical protein